MKVKSEREVAQSCPTPSDPMDCSPPGSSTLGIFQARVLELVPLPSPSIPSSNSVHRYLQSCPNTPGRVIFPKHKSYLVTSFLRYLFVWCLFIWGQQVSVTVCEVKPIGSAESKPLAHQGGPPTTSFPGSPSCLFIYLFICILVFYFLNFKIFNSYMRSQT